VIPFESVQGGWIALSSYRGKAFWTYGVKSPVSVGPMRISDWLSIGHRSTSCSEWLICYKQAKLESEQNCTDFLAPRGVASAPDLKLGQAKQCRQVKGALGPWVDGRSSLGLSFAYCF
jgi:hypothetical protein